MARFVRKKSQVTHGSSVQQEADDDVCDAYSLQGSSSSSHKECLDLLNPSDRLDAAVLSFSFSWKFLFFWFVTLKTSGE